MRRGSIDSETEERPDGGPREDPEKGEEAKGRGSGGRSGPGGPARRHGRAGARGSPREGTGVGGTRNRLRRRRGRPPRAPLREGRRNWTDSGKPPDGSPKRWSPEGPSVAAEPEGALLELLTFAMAGEQYAIDIERIAEIISPRQATTVPNAPAPVVGIISLRGTIVTMLDLRRELGHGPAAAIGPETRTIVVDDSGSLAGFVVDRVLRVVKVRPAQIQAQPVVSPAEQSDAVRGVFQSGTSLTIVLDVEKLLAHG